MSAETIHPGPSPEQLATVHPINAEVEAAMQAAQQPEQAIGDIVNVDVNDRGHRPDGKYLSDYEMTAIAAHQDQIREGLPGLAKDRASDLVAIDANDRAHRSNGQFLSNHELVQIDAHRDQIREGIAARKAEEGTNEAIATTEEDRKDADLASELAEERRLLKEAIEASKARSNQDPELAAVQEPIEDPSPQGLRARAKRIFNAVGAKLGMIQANGLGALRNQEQAEEGWTTRRKVMGAAIGATLLAAGAVLAYKGISSHHGAETALPTPTPTGSGAGHEAAKHVVSLHEGQNPWTVSEHQLKLHGIHNPTDAQIQAYDEKLMKLNDITPKGAHELPVGFQVQTLNEEQIHEALSKVA